MTNTFVRLSKPIDPARAETLVRVARIAADKGVAFVVVGAFARDVHFEHMWAIPTRRNTADLDLAVQVKDWSHYERLRQGLTANAGFTPVAGRTERFVVSNGTILDIIPFGGVADAGGIIFWPPDHNKMSVTGVADAFEHAVLLELSDTNGSVDVRLTSIPGLVILKIIAIFDRPEVRVKKDTDDIQFILANYLSAGNRLRLESGRDSDLLQTQSLDLDLVSARLLGRDMARMSSTTTRASLVDHLRHEATSAGNCPLAQELRNLLRGDFRRARATLSSLLQGYVEAGH
jgi:predicted nucleotidyltransferase